MNEHSNEPFGGQFGRQARGEHHKTPSTAAATSARGLTLVLTGLGLELGLGAHNCQNQPVGMRHGPSVPKKTANANAVENARSVFHVLGGQNMPPPTNVHDKSSKNDYSKDR